MKSLWACVLILGACASDAASRRPAASAETERSEHAREVRRENRAAVAAQTTNDETVALEARREPLDTTRDTRAAAPARVEHAASSHDGVVAGRDTKVAPAGRDTTVVPAVETENRADDTGVNRRDVTRETVTPLDQKENSGDLKITQRIRQAVIADDSLSFNAKNVKIITQNGHVVLRGPVKNAAERTAIAAHASKVAGATHIENQLEIAH